MTLLTDDKIFKAIKELPKDKKKEVFDFIEFLLSKTRKRKKTKNADAILAVSVWNDEDISKIKTAGDEVSKWKIQEF